MQISTNNLRWYDKLLAAFAHYTTLPLGRMAPRMVGCGLSVVEFWPLTGWLTSVVMASVIMFGSMVMPYAVSVALAMCVRLLLTGAIHERGLCAFADGLAARGTDGRVMISAMQGRGAGPAGVVAVVAYHLLLFGVLCSLDYDLAAFTVFAADPFAKMVASQAVMMMPHASGAGGEGSAPGAYRPGTVAGLCLAVQGLLPMAAYIYYMWGIASLQYVVFAPCIVMYVLYMLVWHRLRGYTEAVLSTMFLSVELSVLLMVAALFGGA